MPYTATTGQAFYCPGPRPLRLVKQPDGTWSADPAMRRRKGDRPC